MQLQFATDLSPRKNIFLPGSTLYNPPRIYTGDGIFNIKIMALSKEQLEALYHKYVQNQCTQQELDALINELGFEGEQVQEETINQLFNATWDGLDVFPDKYELPALTLPQEITYETPVVSLYAVKRRWMRIAAAASVVLVLGVAAYWLIRTRETKPGTTTTIATTKDISPGGNKAVLILADNSTIVLDSAANGQLAQQGTAIITKSKDGQLAYSLPDRGEAKPVFNTLRTPRGGQYQLVLPDGSKVWLNAASAITYPTSFPGKERKITIDGEAYLEVAHNAAKPFKVEANGTEVEVLGTHFNVHAYTDEPAEKITLIEGRVKVGNRQSAIGNQSIILKPGEQAELIADSRFTIHEKSSINIEEVLAWKNGQFLFDNSSIDFVMKQIERWYDVEVVYEGQKPEGHFKGKIPRSVMASEMLKIIEASGIHFRIENKKIIIMK
jgi:ferric-dicitrate binding protein FerR (iron transport regulator)